MVLLNTYEDRDEAENAESLISGEKRLASERDGTELIFNLFGQPSWNNFYKLKMFNLPLLKELIELRKANKDYDIDKHKEIIAMLKYAANTFELDIPKHWL
ncbi:hypothetical protein [Pseudoalteromonas sp. UBA2102]|uniref:hypothetical protein n=1 Tax=Pseudoalteromonas sp. UBA2102 TaxID=1947291 RepID=UPI00257E591B|nr:hypothetical protein [Pseudoalteromonas sp. UBA2102]|tara:strand:- start:738 stop:1040 length:303 start_codon:yes stop_codon:yes gene_type:complete